MHLKLVCYAAFLNSLQLANNKLYERNWSN